MSGRGRPHSIKVPARSNWVFKGIDGKLRKFAPNGSTDVVPDDYEWEAGGNRYRYDHGLKRPVRVIATQEATVPCQVSQQDDTFDQTPVANNSDEVVGSGSSGIADVCVQQIDNARELEELEKEVLTPPEPSAVVERRRKRKKAAAARKQKLDAIRAKRAKRVRLAVGDTPSSVRASVVTEQASTDELHLTAEEIKRLKVRKWEAARQVTAKQLARFTWAVEHVDRDGANWLLCNPCSLERREPVLMKPKWDAAEKHEACASHEKSAGKWGNKVYVVKADVDTHLACKPIIDGIQKTVTTQEGTAIVQFKTLFFLLKKGRPADDFPDICKLEVHLNTPHASVGHMSSTSYWDMAECIEQALIHDLQREVSLVDSFGVSIDESEMYMDVELHYWLPNVGKVVNFVKLHRCVVRLLYGLLVLFAS